VVVEDVAVLDEMVRPSPDDVEMLRLVRVEPVADDVRDAKCGEQAEDGTDRDALAGSEGAVGQRRTSATTPK
jgi:hypothetical protein